jgi:hypothetical protein
MQQNNFRFSEPFFPGETFRVLKKKELRLFGAYRTRRLVMEAWRVWLDNLGHASDNVCRT